MKMFRKEIIEKFLLEIERKITKIENFRKKM